MKIPKFFDQYFDALHFAPNLRSMLITELTAPHRHYHGLGHISLMLNNIGDSTMVREYIAATLFHDIVYDVNRNDNEEMSAVEATLWLDDKTHQVNVEVVRDLILATKHHNSSSPRERYFIDLDLSILSAPSHQYRWYANGIRKEYAHVPNDAYRKGRAQVLLGLMNEKRQKNIAWELDGLVRGEFDV